MLFRSGGGPGGGAAAVVPGVAEDLGLRRRIGLRDKAHHLVCLLLPSHRRRVGLVVKGGGSVWSLLPLAGVCVCVWRVGGGGMEYIYPRQRRGGILGRISCFAFWGEEDEI